MMKKSGVITAPRLWLVIAKSYRALSLLAEQSIANTGLCPPGFRRARSSVTVMNASARAFGLFSLHVLWISKGTPEVTLRLPCRTLFQAIEPWSGSMGVSDPEIQKKVFGPRWQHEVEKQSWPLWKRLIHRLQRCPLCNRKTPARNTQ